MLSHLRDLMRYTSNLGIEVLKITGTNGQVAIEGVSDNRSVVLKGTFRSELPELDGIFGLGQLDYLSKLVNVYKEKGDELTIRRQEKSFSVAMMEDDEPVLDAAGNQTFEQVTEEIISEFKFTREKPKMENSYRVLDRRMIPDQFNFTGNKWDVVIKPTKQAIDLLATQTSFGVEENFGVTTDNNTLYLTFGDPSSQAVVEFANNIKGKIVRPWVWEASAVLNILKLSDNAECTMSFLDKGALQVTLETGLAEYNYLMPAKAR